jgi:hypothetical protein
MAPKEVDGAEVAKHNSRENVRPRQAGTLRRSTTGVGPRS